MPPAWLTSDDLTLLGFAAQITAGVFYAISPAHNRWLFSPSTPALSSTGSATASTAHSPASATSSARATASTSTTSSMSSVPPRPHVRTRVVRPCCTGKPRSRCSSPSFILSAESYLATHTLSRSRLSQGLFGPTELRILLISATSPLLRRPLRHILGHRILLFDIGGAIGAASMFVLAIVIAIRHTAELYQQEPLHVNPLLRWLKFNLVGAMGMVLQLATLALLNHFAPGHYSSPPLRPSSSPSCTTSSGTCTTPGATPRNTAR